LPQANWGITKVAFTAGGGRKFLHGPAVLPASSGTVYLALGSGDREHPLINEYPFPGAVTTNGVQNRFYVYLDNLRRTTATDLDDASLLPNNSSASCTTPKLLPGADANSSTAQRGWFLNLGSGEQTVTSAAIVGGLAAFSTNTPTNPLTGACSSLGEAAGYLVSLFSGSGAIGVSGTCGGTTKGIFKGGGLAPSPVVATVPLDDGSVVTVLLGAAQKTAGTTNSTLEAQNVDPPISPIRKGVYWRRSGDN
jgi:type IV pilus assembly protein PilY1